MNPPSTKPPHNMSELLRKLQATSSSAAASIHADEETKKRAAAERRLQHDLQRADGLIRDLPPLLEEAAQNGQKSMDVMRLDRLIHCPKFDADTMLREYRLHGITTDNLLGGAFQIAKWLTDQGLSVYIREDKHTDEEDGGGRSWSDLQLGASWTPE